jgi:hypothetical protein
VSAVTLRPQNPPPRALELAPFRGGGRWVMGGGVAGVVFLILTFIGAAVSPREAFFSYLVAFVYWCGLALASVILLMIFHATHARWMTVLRRPLEVMAASVAIFLVLFIPVAVGMKYLYVWVDPPADLARETLKLIAHKRPYLNVTGFVVRAVVYLLLGTFLSQRLYGWSLRQDVSGEVALTQRQRNLGAGGLPFIALAMTFAAFDWLMSLNPAWFSTVFGVYYFAGSFVATLSLLAVVTDMGRARQVFAGHMTDEHTHNIGKLMLGFTCFWTYIGFSQLLLIWIAGLPEETPFYIVRFGSGWAWVGAFLIFGHFFLPFGALLSRSLKRNPRRLAVVAIWILLVHYIDIFWLVMPTLHPEGFSLHWTNFTAFLGVGLLAVAFAVSRLRGRFAIPVRDPYLAESLRYRQP